MSTHRLFSVLFILALTCILTGCLHGRGEHQIPVTRNYADLQKTPIKEVCPLVLKAHRVGAEHFAPYEYVSAKSYAHWAKEERAESDFKGEWDFAALAKQFAESAIANGAGVPDKGETALPDNIQQCQAEFDRLVARYRELSPCKAKLVAPEIYAHIEAQLAIAEHELKEKCHYIDAARQMRCVEADIDAIWAKDVDKDGIKDMQDGDPWIPEDADGFQDEDGIPEPKPYPILLPVYFQENCAKLSPEAKGYLRGIANMLLNGYKEVTVYLSGHTNNNASEEYNQKLSQKRVENVKAFLLECGAKNEMLSSEFFGESKPAVDNNTPEGKAKNRRVEIRLDSVDVKSPYCN